MNILLLILFAILIVASIILSIVALVKPKSTCHCPSVSPSAGRRDTITTYDINDINDIIRAETLPPKYIKELQELQELQDLPNNLSELKTTFGTRLSALETSALKNNDTIYLKAEDGQVIYGNSLPRNNRPGSQSILKISKS